MTSEGEQSADRTWRDTAFHLASLAMIPFLILVSPFWMFYWMFVIEPWWKNQTTREERSKHLRKVGGGMPAAIEITFLYLRSVPLDEYYWQEGIRDAE